MTFRFARSLALLCCALWALPCQAVQRDVPAGTLIRASQRIPDLENRPINYHVERLAGDEQVPILIVIDGSGCAGVLRPGFASLYRPSVDSPYRYAKLTVDKPGIDPEATDSRDCPPEFHERRSLDSAVQDHLRVLQHLRGNASWWDGRVYVWGWSEGGDIGARLVAYYPDVERAVLGAMGGGLTMAQHIEDFWDCAEDRVDDREACLADVREMLEDLRLRPVPVSENGGDSNLLWRSRMFTDMAALLRYGETPVLVTQGALDRDHTPVQSARLLVTRLRDYRRGNVAYCEVPDMGHGTGSLEVERALEYEDALLAWLFDPAGAEAALAVFCDPEPPLGDVAPPVSPAT